MDFLYEVHIKLYLFSFFNIVFFHKGVDGFGLFCTIFFEFFEVNANGLNEVIGFVEIEVSYEFHILSQLIALGVFLYPLNQGVGIEFTMGGEV